MIRGQYSKKTYNLTVRVIILNAYVPHKRVSKYMRQKLTVLQEGRTHESITWLDAYDAPLSEMDRSRKQPVSTELTSTAPKSTVFLNTINKHTNTHMRAHDTIYNSIKKYSRNKAPKSLTLLE